jgi:hypothetical protein
MTLNGTQIQSSEHLEELIVDLPEESKTALRDLFALEQTATE